MADVIPFGRRDDVVGASSRSTKSWRLVTVRPEAPGYAVEIWTGKPGDDDTIRALAGIRSNWRDAMDFALERARALSINEVVDWGGAPEDGRGSAA